MKINKNKKDDTPLLKNSLVTFQIYSKHVLKHK